MDSRVKGSLVFIRVHSGEDLFSALEDACKKYAVNVASVVSAVGMLEAFTLGYFRGKGDYAKQHFKKPHELVALSGLIIKLSDGYNFHLHAALGNENKKLIGGHLVSARVKVTAEIVLLKSDATLSRVLDKETGLMALRL